MHIHILGICGTFMAGIAVLAKQMGYRVTGSDAHALPPMSTQLEEQGIEVWQGYEVEHLEPVPDCILVGNALSRGNPAVEAILEKNLPYQSAPQWLYENVLREKWVLAVAGTHGKTSTSSMLAWVLEQAGMSPGFLIGGVPQCFGVSARLGETPFFVIEADEYDTAFFDKRSKFVHYHPRTLVMNNLEFDHADIFENLAAIQKQFHHLVRIVPGQGKIIYPSGSQALQDVIEMGCWSETETMESSKGWQAQLLEDDGSSFEVCFAGESQGRVQWDLIGEHNVSNALSAIAAARHAGVSVEVACEALSTFKNAKRRLEVIAQNDTVTVYDDFAHHPSAIATTIAGLRAKVGDARIVAVVEPRSNSMRMGAHKVDLAPALSGADSVRLFQPEDVDWSVQSVVDELENDAHLFADVQALVDEFEPNAEQETHWVIMSNGFFNGLHAQLKTKLEASDE